jgi:hypothetical protein
MQESTMQMDELYTKISGNECIFLNELRKYNYLQKTIYGLIIGSFLIIVYTGFSFPLNTQMTGVEAFNLNPIMYLLFWFGFAVYFSSMIGAIFVQNRRVSLRKKIGLEKEEELFLLSYKILRNLKSILAEKNTARKPFHLKKTIKLANELTDKLRGWQVGNVRLISDAAEKQIEQLKSYLSNNVLPNLIKIDEAMYKQISDVFFNFCLYLKQPSEESLDYLNHLIAEKKFDFKPSLTGQKRILNYLYSNPRGFRLLFSSALTAIIVGAVMYVSSNWGLAITVGVACFWGSFTAFDKLFTLHPLK